MLLKTHLLLRWQWEDKLRSECSRLKGELDTLHAEEKHLAVESIKVQKEQELQNLKKSFESKSEEMNKEVRISGNSHIEVRVFAEFEIS